LRTSDQIWFLREELAPVLMEYEHPRRTETIEVSEFRWKLTEKMPESEWEQYDLESPGDYTVAFMGSGVTELEACKYAFEKAFRNGWRFKRHRLWSEWGKMDDKMWKRKRENRRLDEPMFYYFRLLLR